MVVWLKPCESRSSPGFTPKTPLLTQRGFSLCARNAGAGRWPATRWHYIARQIHAMRGCSLRGATAPTKVGRYPQKARTAIDGRPAAGNFVRGKHRVVPAAGRQPDGVTSPGRSTPSVDPPARNSGANQGWPLPTAGPHSNRLPASGRHYQGQVTHKKTAPCGRRPDQDRMEGPGQAAWETSSGSCWRNTETASVNVPAWFCSSRAAAVASSTSAALCCVA